MNDTMANLLRRGLRMPGDESRYIELAQPVNELVLTHAWGFGIGSHFGGGGPDLDAYTLCGGLFGFAVWSGYVCLVAHTGENGRGMNLWVDTNIPIEGCEVPLPDEPLLKSARQEFQRRKGIYDFRSEREVELIQLIAKRTLALANGTIWHPWLGYSSWRQKERALQEA